MPKKMKSFRLDEICCGQLDDLSEIYGVSQADIIQYLVNLLSMVQYNECLTFDLTGFKQFMDSTFSYVKNYE